MQTLHMQFLASLRGAQQFLVANDATFGAVNTTGARKELDASIDHIAALSEAQDTHRINVTGQVRNAAKLAASFRRAHIRPIVEICRAKLPAEASLSNVTFPDSRLNITELVQRGLAIADAVMPFVQVFIDAGLAPDFIARMKAAADELVKVVTRKTEHRAGRLGATDGLVKAVRKARRSVRVLDAMVRATVPVDEPLVAQWRSAVRVIRGGGGRIPAGRAVQAQSKAAA